MKFLKKFLIGLIGAVALFVVIGLFLPREVSVSREALINAPPEKVFAHINDLKKWNTWSPWAKRDPDIKQTFSGPNEGLGQKVVWTSDHDQVGNGTQEIVESVPNQMIRTALDFGDMGTAKAAFNLEGFDGGTRITWGFETDMGSNPMMRWMGLMMDGWIGADYEAGLAALKDVAEKEAGL